MNKATTTTLALGLAGLALGLILWISPSEDPGNLAPSAQDGALQGRQDASLHASHAMKACDDTEHLRGGETCNSARANSVSDLPRGSTETAKRSVAFSDPRTPLRALLHKAQVEKSEISVEMALAYVKRCTYLEGIEDAIKRKKPSESQLQKLAGMRQFCDGYLTPTQTDDVRALSDTWLGLQASKYGQRDVNTLQPSGPRSDYAPRIAAAVGSRDGDLILARLNEIGTTEQRKAWLIQHGFTEAQVSTDKLQPGTLTGAVMAVAVCTRYGCDADWYQMLICQWSNSCADGSLEQTARTNYESFSRWSLSSGIGKSRPSWDEVQAAANRVLDRLERGGP